MLKLGRTRIHSGGSELPLGRDPVIVSGDWLSAALGLVGKRRIASVTPRQALKRGFDVAFASLALAGLLPLLALIALAIKVDSRGPVFYRVRRVGFRGRPLMMLKFRKMHHNADGSLLTTGGDPRLTRVGAMLTRAKLDELPQLWDVICGRMSVVGPRPEDPSFVGLHDHAYRQILSVRPGITGFSQLAFADEQRILEVHDAVADYVARILPQKVAMDIMYASACDLRRDMRVLRWTVCAVVLRKQVAVNRATGGLTLRQRRVAPRQQDDSSVPFVHAA